MKAKRASAPAQINVPRDFWTQVIEIELPAIVDFERPSGGEEAIARAAELLSNAKFPVILNGGGVVIGGAIKDAIALAERLDAPVCCGYQHNDAFPGSHPLFAGPLGYNGSKAGMELISKADVVLALGTRLNPFSTLPGYGIDYWPAGAAIIQVDINPDRIGLTKPVTVGIVGDAKKVANGILAKLSATAGDAGTGGRAARLQGLRFIAQRCNRRKVGSEKGCDFSAGKEAPAAANGLTRPVHVRGAPCSPAGASRRETPQCRRVQPIFIAQ